MDSLISIIIPVYNVKEYLSTALESVICQTYKNIEIIIVDDGSTDGSSTICEKYAKIDSRIIVLHKKNGGLSDARNIGLSIAKGEYIVFFDSDDILSIDLVEILFRALVDSDADIAFCHYRSFAEDVNDPNFAINKSRTGIISGNAKCMEAYIAHKLIHPMAWAKLYKSELLKDIKYPINKFHEDVFTTFKIIAKCNSISYTTQQLYYYRQRRGSIMNKSFDKRHLDLIEAKKTIYNFVNNNYKFLASQAKGEIVYAAITCALRLSKSSHIDRTVLNLLQTEIRENEFSFLQTKHSLKAKFVSILCYLDLSIVIYSLHYLLKVLPI